MVKLTMVWGMFAVLALALMPAMSLNALEALEGLALYYDFDEPGVGQIEDQSGSGNTGVVKGNSEWIDGPEGMGSALRFQTNADYVEAAHSESLKPESITIALWIKSELDAGSIEMLRKFIWPNLGYLIKVEPQFNYTMLFLFDGGASHGLMIPLVEKDKWEHVAVTFDGENQIGYLNGELSQRAGGAGQAIMPWAGALVHSNNPLTIGGISGYKGAVDDVAIYNRALSAEEIKETTIAGHSFPVEPGGRLITTWARLKSL